MPPKKSNSSGRAKIAYDKARDQDVISGRGDKAIRHVGNGKYRRWINERKDDYDHSGNNGGKRDVCHMVIDMIRNSQKPKGRFLRLKGDGKKVDFYWEELTEKEVMGKTSQAFRDSKGVGGSDANNRGSGSKITASNDEEATPALRTATKKETNPKQPSALTARSTKSSLQEAAAKKVTRKSISKVISPDEKPTPVPSSSISIDTRSRSPRKAAKKRYPPSSGDEEEEDEDELEKQSGALIVYPPAKRHRALLSDEEDDDGETATITDSTVSRSHRHSHLRQQEQPPKQEGQDEEHQQQLDPFVDYHLSETFSDIEIVCEDDNGSLGVVFPGHKYILVASSLVLKAALEGDPSCASVAFHYPSVVVKEVLTFLYTHSDISMNEVVVEEYLWDFLSISKAYGFMELYHRIFQKAFSLIKMENLMDTLITADQQGIKDVCMAFIQAHPAKVLTNLSFVRFGAKNPCLWQEVVAAALSGAAAKGVIEHRQAGRGGETYSFVKHKLNNDEVEDCESVDDNMTV